MINVAISCPSEVPGAVLDVKKGRSTISFTLEDLMFIADIFEVILNNESPKIHKEVEIGHNYRPGAVIEVETEAVA